MLGRPTPVRGEQGISVSWVANLPAHAMVETTIKHEKRDQSAGQG